MRQRVTIALATICKPDFIIADEPTTALDVIVQKNVLDMIREIQRQMGSSVLLVTHDLGVHAYLADRLGIMYAGRIVEEGPTHELFQHPRHPYTAHLVSSLPRIGDAIPRKGLEGSPPSLAAPPNGCRFHPRCPLAMERCRSEVPGHGCHFSGSSRRLFCDHNMTVQNTALLELDHVCKDYVRGGLLSRQRIRAVDDVSFRLESARPEIFAIIGESGSGKSTLASMILNLVKPTTGHLRFSGTDLADVHSRSGRLSVHGTGSAHFPESV